jgi:predicted nucleic acid-binding protein
VRFLDTNILLYSISRDGREVARRDIAVALLERRDNALTAQVLQEFFVQATRPTRPDALPHEIAVGLIRTWLRFPVQEITLAVLTGALDIKLASGLCSPMERSTATPASTGLAASLSRRPS